MAYKILIIDDDTELLKMLKKFLEIKKYEIITAENGLEGLNKIKLQPDIILLDVNMPNIDGIEVCRRVRDKVACPILFLTARVDEQDVVNGLSSGGDDYILKPFSLKELDARITAHLKRETRRKEKTECCFQGELSIDYKAKTVQIHTDYLELTRLEYGIIVSVYSLISLLFKSPLPAVPLLFLYIVYSNMGSRNVEGIYGYYGRPLAIMVRFPGKFFDTAPPPMVLLNQSFLILAAICIIFLSMQIWKRRRVY